LDFQLLLGAYRIEGVLAPEKVAWSSITVIFAIWCAVQEVEE
jgi:hypothetical protein